MKIKGSILFFTIFLIPLTTLFPLSSKPRAISLSSHNGFTLFALLSQGELLPPGSQTLLTFNSGVDLNLPTLKMGIYAGGLGAAPSVLREDISYRGFSGLQAGLDLFCFPGTWSGFLGFGGGLSGNLLNYDYTYQWFFIPAIKFSILLRYGEITHSPITLDLLPEIVVFLRRDLTYSVAFGLGARLQASLFKRAKETGNE